MDDLSGALSGRTSAGSALPSRPPASDAVFYTVLRWKRVSVFHDASTYTEPSAAVFISAFTSSIVLPLAPIVKDRTRHSRVRPLHLHTRRFQRRADTYLIAYTQHALFEGNTIAPSLAALFYALSTLLGMLKICVSQYADAHIGQRRSRTL